MTRMILPLAFIVVMSPALALNISGFQDALITRLIEGKEQGKSFVGTPEMRERFSESTYEVTIRLDGGRYTQVTRRDGASYRVGERVRVSGIELELIAP